MKKHLLTTSIALFTLFQAKASPCSDSLKIVLGDTIIVTTGSNENSIIITNPGKSGKTDKHQISNKTSCNNKHFTVSYLMMDVGLNGFYDKTNYQSSEAINFVRVEDQYRDNNLMDINAAVSRNFNLWPVMFSFNPLKSKNQKLLFSSGFGFQWYSFKFTNPVRIEGGLDPHVRLTDLEYSKNKLGITYLSVPLMLTGQTRISGNKWLTYGIGVIGGYRIQSWTNRHSSTQGREKIKDSYNLEPFQWSLTAEIGVTNVLRLYGTYQMTNMWKNGLHQQPFAIGLRLLGI